MHHAAKELTCNGVCDTVDNNANNTPPNEDPPAGPSVNSNPDGTMNSTNSPGENTSLERGRVSGGGKERRARAGIRDEVAERLRLRTKPQAVDPPNTDNPRKEPAPLATTSKRKKPPAPPTM
jgi:hypothetical protein